MAHYMVTGAAGFIGSHLADALLASGHKVRAVDDFSTGSIDNLDPRCEVVTADVTDRHAMLDAMQGVDGCFHLAAIASVERANKDWIDTHRTNQTGTITVLDAARMRGGTPVVYASSAAIYGDQGNNLAHEDARPSPLTAYGADKLGSELHARVAHAVHRTPTLGMRFFNVYGPRQDPGSPYSGVISIFARSILRRVPLMVHGDGAQVRDFIYVSDVVTHLVAGMKTMQLRADATVMNVCTGDGTRIRDLAFMLADIADSVPDVSSVPARVGDIRYSVGDPSFATETLGVSARVSLRDGLTATMASLSVSERRVSEKFRPERLVAERPAGEPIRPDVLRAELPRVIPGWLPRRVRAN